MRTPLALGLTLAALVLAPLPASAGAPPADAGAGPAVAAKPDPAPRELPRLRVTTVVDDLATPWDVQPIGNGRLLFTERDSRTLTLVRRNGATAGVRFDRSRMWSSGETGLMGLEIDPGFADNRRIYTCSGWNKPGGGHDIRVHAWRLGEDLTDATRSKTLVKGLPTTSGRHGGCRLLITRSGALLVGTGDAAQSNNPQSLRSLGGKTLRLDRMSGAPWPENPWAGATGKKRYLYTYGHRNVQGLAQRKDGSLWSVEHGTYRDDEINRLGPGRNFGWRPGPGYDESRPMTDHSLPGRQYGARWRSGEPTIATSGASFVGGKGWGRLSGTLAVGCLGGSRVVFVKFSPKGRLMWTKAPDALRRHGRIRSVTRDGRSLLLTTSNGVDDKLLRATPRG